jgi:hypothetical protein
MQGKLPNSLVFENGSYTIDWAQPAAIPFFMGVAAMENIEEKASKGERATVGDTIMEGLIAGGDTLINQSMLRNVKDLFGGAYSSPTEGLIKTGVDYFAQATPTVMGQVARTIDPTKRQIDYSGLLSGALTGAQAKTPGKSSELPAKYDLLGNVQTYGKKGLVNAFNQFLNPGTVGTKQDSKVVDELVKLSEVEGTSVIPRVAPSYFTSNKQRIDLTPEQKSNFQREMGEYVNNRLSALFKTIDYSTSSSKDKAKLVDKILDEAYNKAKETILRGL